MGTQQRPIWRTPSEIVQVGFGHSRVVMMNEAHNGLMRSIRTRRIGQSVLPAAHQAGARILAMEALFPDFAEECNRRRRVPDVRGGGYLAQAEMRTLIQAALDLGWSLLAYEADDRRCPNPNKDFRSIEYTNWREEEQARNLALALGQMPAQSKILVWCGNGHHQKAQRQEWTPMGCHFVRLSGLNPFVIDQMITVKMDAGNVSFGDRLCALFEPDLAKAGGTLGFLHGEGPVETDELIPMDAYILSTDNEIE